MPDDTTLVTGSFQAVTGLYVGPADDPVPVGPLTAATPSVIGGVLEGAAVANATNTTDVITNFNALLTSLRASGAIASS